MPDDNHVYIGNRTTWEQDATFSLSTPARRHHMYIAGQTGTGKSTLLRNLIIQDIALGHGVGIIDPHGDLAESLLDHIPPWRTRDVLYFNPADRDYPIGMNLLHQVGESDAEVLARQFGGMPPFSPRHFSGLNNHEICVKMMEDGGYGEPFTGTTLPPLNYHHGRREQIIRRSREQYATPRSMVEARINRWIMR